MPAVPPATVPPATDRPATDRPATDRPAADRPATGRPPARRAALLDRAGALDGLRGVALVLVVTYHFTGARGPLPGGWAGLDVFFVLSGLLITVLLLDERRVTGRIRLGRFYARRALRLLPALLLLLAAWTALLPVAGGTTWFAATPGGDGSGDPVAVGPALAQVGLVLAYGVNWLYALDSGRAPLAHLWSLSVEEQFYLLWPLLLLGLLALPAARRAWPVVALAAGSAALPWLLYDAGAGRNRIYFGTDTRAVGLLVGALAALHWHRRRAAGRPAGPAAGWAWLALAALAAVTATLGNVPAKFTVAPTGLALLAAAVVLHLLDRPAAPMARLLSGRLLVWLGRRSYGLYLWHYLWATWTHPLPGRVGVPLGVLGALACAELSWRLVERPAMACAARLRAPRVQGPLQPAL